MRKSLIDLFGGSKWRYYFLFHVRGLGGTARYIFERILPSTFLECGRAGTVALHFVSVLLLEGDPLALTNLGLNIETTPSFSLPRWILHAGFGGGFQRRRTTVGISLRSRGSSMNQQGNSEYKDNFFFQYGGFR
jgi:hypothetical protein